MRLVLPLLLLLVVSLRADPIGPGVYTFSGTGTGSEFYPVWEAHLTLIWDGGMTRDAFDGSEFSASSGNAFWGLPFKSFGKMLPFEIAVNDAGALEFFRFADTEVALEMDFRGTPRWQLSPNSAGNTFNYGTLTLGTVNSIPEPATVVLVGSVLIAIAGKRHLAIARYRRTRLTASPPQRSPKPAHR